MQNESPTEIVAVQDNLNMRILHLLKDIFWLDIANLWQTKQKHSGR